MPVEGPFANVRFVLVEPLSAGNVGAAARALKNLGFRRLVAVAPRCDPNDREGRGMAVDAADLLAAIEIVDDLDRALLQAGTVVGATAQTGKQRRPHYRLDGIATDLARLAQAGELAFVFGREDRGLTDAELDRCTHLVHYLAADEYRSFNLAQAVLLAAYEIRRALSGALPVAAGAIADDGQREAMYAHLESALRATGFLHGDTVVGRMRRLRRILGRAELGPGDVQVFRGIARQILWLARVRGCEGPIVEPTLAMPEDR